MKRASCLCLIVFLGVAPLRGQSDPSNNANPTVQELLDRIQKLEERIAQLERKQQGEQPGAPKASALAAAPAAPAPPSHEHPAPVSPENLPETEVRYPTFAMHGFADIDFSAQDNLTGRKGTATGFTPPGTSSGFSLGQFVLHFAGGLAPKVSYFGELSWTASATGYSTEVERSILRYDYNDHLKVSFGRYHTPINYWNTAFHHGTWLHTSISRPEMIQFGGRLIPVHFVGALVEGTVPGTGSLNLNYNLGLGNGRGSIISRPGDAGDVDNNRAWLATLFVRPDWAYGWQVGGSVYRDKIGLGKNLNFGETIEAAHIIYSKEKPELLAEFANIHHERLNGSGTFNSQAWYVQVGYRLPWFEQTWKPYYRYEYIHIPKGDPVFNPSTGALPSLAGSLVGLRYDITSYAAIKAEYRRSRRGPKDSPVRVNGLFLQTSLTF